jgi:hypothetical protein
MNDVVMAFGIGAVNSQQERGCFGLYDRHVAAVKKAPLDEWRARVKDAKDALSRRERQEVSGREIERRMVPQPRPGAVSRWLTGARGKRISSEYHAALARVLGVHDHWLRSGEGPRELDAGVRSKAEQVFEGLPTVDKEMRRVVEALYEIRPDADPAEVRRLLIKEEQLIVRDDVRRGKPRKPDKKPKPAVESVPNSVPKSKRQTGTQ